MQAQTERDINASIVMTCDKCGHISVCAIYRAIAPLLAQKWTDEDRPFEPEQIAGICRHFVSATLINTLTEDRR